MQSLTDLCDKCGKSYFNHTIRLNGDISVYEAKIRQTWPYDAQALNIPLNKVTFLCPNT